MVGFKRRDTVAGESAIHRNGLRYRGSGRRRLGLGRFGGVFGGEEVEGEFEGLLAFPGEVGLALGGGLETAIVSARAGGAVGEAGGFGAASEMGVEALAQEGFGVEDVEEAQQEAVGAETAGAGGGAITVGGVAVADAAGDGFTFEGVAEAFHEDGFALGEIGVLAAVADDGGERLAGGEGGFGALVMFFEFAKVDGDPGLGGRGARRDG
jgi:hypothetical protein